MISVELKSAIRSVKYDTENYFDTKRLLVEDGKVMKVFGHRLDNKTWAAPMIENPHYSPTFIHTRIASGRYDVLWISYYDQNYLLRRYLISNKYGYYLPVDKWDFARGLGLL
jgi:hypothetical protein